MFEIVLVDYWSFHILIRSLIPVTKQSFCCLH